MSRLLPLLLVAFLGACPSVETPPDAWCDVPPTEDDGLQTLPPAARALLDGGLDLDPASVTCPAADFSNWPAFVRRHTVGYTADPRFAGFDDDCVPFIDLEGRYGGVEDTQTPLVVGNYGLLRYGDLLRGIEPQELPEACRGPEAAVIAQATRLRDMAVVRSTDGVEHWSFPYDFPNLQGEIDPPWTSGYAQGIVAPAFVAAFCVDQDPAWLDAASATLRDLVVRMPDGGVATWVGEDAVWFEEAAAVDARSARSLNGHLGAAAGVHAVAQWTGVEGVATLRDYAFNAAVRELPRYDAGFISLYTQWAVDHPLIAPALDYNRFHVQQLSWLHAITGDAAPLRAAFAFARYDDPFLSWSDDSGDPASVAFTDNLVYEGVWLRPSPATLRATSPFPATFRELVLWGPEQTARPESIEVVVSGASRSGTWTEGCNDHAMPLDLVGTDVTITFDGLSTVGLQAVGLPRDTGHPTGVARWEEHGVANRPASAFTDVGWIWGRASAVTFDLHGVFPTVELTMTGFRGDALPVVSTAAAPEGPFAVLATPPVQAEEGVLVWSFAPAGDFVRVVVDTPSVPGADPRIFIRQ